MVMRLSGRKAIQFASTNSNTCDRQRWRPLIVFSAIMQQFAKQIQIPAAQLAGCGISERVAGRGIDSQFAMIVRDEALRE
jgi:hypothetical protein